MSWYQEEATGAKEIPSLGKGNITKKKNVGLGLKEKKTLCPSQTHRLPGVLRGVWKAIMKIKTLSLHHT